jgi:hypothetical protein
MLNNPDPHLQPQQDSKLQDESTQSSARSSVTSNASIASIPAQFYKPPDPAAVKVISSGLTQEAIAQKIAEAKRLEKERLAKEQKLKQEIQPLSALDIESYRKEQKNMIEKQKAKERYERMSFLRERENTERQSEAERKRQRFELEKSFSGKFYVR